MTVIQELREGVGEVNWNGAVIVDASRTFLVRANTSEAAITDADLPLPREAYSGSQPFLQATSRRVVEGPFRASGSTMNHWKVEVGYSYQSREIQTNPVNDTAPDYRDDQGELANIVVNVPVITEQTITVDQPIPLAPITVKAYSTREQKLEVTGSRYTITLNVPASTPSNPSGFDNTTFHAAVRAQGDKVHVFGNGQRWWFDSARASRRDVDVYQLTYSWIGEDGNPELTTRYTPAAAGPTVDDPVLPIPARPPFHKYIPITYTDPSDDLQKIRVGVIAERVEDANGWTNLPGLTA